MADLLALLRAYADELDGCARAKKTERAELVRGEIARVADQIRTQIRRLHVLANQRQQAGQDALADQARAEARRLEAALAEVLPDETPQEPQPKRRGSGRGRRTAVDTTPKEIA